MQVEAVAKTPLASRSNSLPVSRARTRPKPVQKPDGILMLLEACEALDLHPRMAGHRSARQAILACLCMSVCVCVCVCVCVWGAILSRPDAHHHKYTCHCWKVSLKMPCCQRLVPNMTGCCRMRKSRSSSDFDRTCSAPLSATWSETEKENVGFLQRAPCVKRPSNLGPKQPRIRRSRSELHGPCCHCHVTGAAAHMRSVKSKHTVCMCCKQTVQGLRWATRFS